jgi:hypothetical protein
VNPVPDSFLLTTASIAATLIGLLLLGTFFYVETGFRRATQIAPLGAPFLRATTRFTLLLYLLVLAISLGEVVLRRPWMLALYGAVGLALLASMVAWVQAYRDLSRVLPIPQVVAVDRVAGDRGHAGAAVRARRVGARTRGPDVDVADRGPTGDHEHH